MALSMLTRIQQMQKRAEKLHAAARPSPTKATAAPLEDDPEAWPRTYLPAAFARPFAERHREMWGWAFDIRPGEAARPFIGIWPRGGGKSTNAEGIAVALGATRRRRYCLYVSETQDQADEHVSNMQSLMLSRELSTAYPGMSNPKLGKHGQSRGWRRNRLWTATGFIVDAMGLDSARRGAKVEDARPDLIILDDIDGKHDTLATTEKKIRTITDSILPAGSIDVAVLGVQNLVTESGVFARLAGKTEEPADFLSARIVSGPFPAVEGLDTEIVTSADGDRTYRIVAGTPTWDGQDLAACEHAINTQGLSAFLRESQHEVEETGGLFGHIDFNSITIDREAVPELIRVTTWVDPAVTAKDSSDSHGIIVDGLGVDDKIYRLYSWEGITTPQDAIERAIRKAREHGSLEVGVETDQGGDTWQSVFNEAIRALTEQGVIEKAPAFTQAKAGSGHGPKVERWSRMLAAYERDEIRHVRGTHMVLERALKRVPLRKPFDLADVAYWGWHRLTAKSDPQIFIF